jgi:signal transduction histidine kinase
MLASDVLAVVREGLANVAKHAGDTQVRVTVGIDDQSVCVEVADDGSGVDPASARGGLVNLSERAAARHGTFEILPEAPHGALLRWRVPR